ncbi:MAG: ABC transporter substrate-binding protein [Thermodesulfobacteriota bacterium]
MRRAYAILLFVVWAMIAASVPVPHGGGVRAEEEIVFGQSADFAGSSSTLGINMRAGIAAAFGEVNSRGGVDGRKLRLITYNDDYEPEKASKNIKKLINEDEVFAIVGTVGTPTAKSSVPIVTVDGVPFVAPLTGAGFLRRKDIYPTVVNVRTTYEREAEAIVDYLVNERGLKRIAVFYQDDSFGFSGLNGVRKALESRGLRIIATASYARNLKAIHSGYFKIRKARPEVIIMVAANRPAVEFVKFARSFGSKSVFAALSFVGSESFAFDLGEKAAGALISQVVPLPWSDNPLANRYRKALKVYAGGEVSPGFVSMEGYIAGRLIVDALGRVEGDLTRDKFLDVIFSGGPFDVDGLELVFSDTDNEGLQKVNLTRVADDGKSFEVVR